MRFQYVFQEIGTGLRRNLTMTVAVVVTVTISLFLLGLALLMRAQASTMKDYWYDRVEISVFMCNAYDTGEQCATGQANEEQKAAILQTLESHPEVESVQFESQDQAYLRFQDRFQDSIAESITADQLQESYRVKLQNPERYEGVVSAVAGLPGVNQVVDLRQILSNFFRMLNHIQFGALALAGLAVLAALLLIANTVRVAAFSRRRETGIMRLVGASNFYIQLPFVIEAAIAGLIGGAVACGFLAVVEATAIQRVAAPALSFTSWVGWSDVFAIMPILLITGVAMAAVTGFITLRRYLRV